MRHRSLRILLLAALAGLSAIPAVRATGAAQPVAGSATSPPASSSPTCDLVFRRVEAEYGIPRNLLRAVALVESGRLIEGRRVSWAYAVNAKGRAYYFSTPRTAAAFVREAVAGGLQVDVGCMQINTRWHAIRELQPDAGDPAFETVEDALDPVKNTEYGASYLAQLYRSEGDWTNAVARYHSGGPYARRLGYACQVAAMLNTIDAAAEPGPAECDDAGGGSDRPAEPAEPSMPSRSRSKDAPV